MTTDSEHDPSDEMGSGTQWRGYYGRLRPPEEQHALIIARRLIIKHQNDIDAALMEWREELKRHSDIVPAVCDFFFHRTIREFDAEVTAGPDEELE